MRAPAPTKAISSPLLCLPCQLHLCPPPSMARNSAYTPFSPSFRFHYITTARHSLPRYRPLPHTQPSLTKQRWEPSLLLSLSTNTPWCAKWIQVFRRHPLCLIQPRPSPRSTEDKFRLCPRLRLWCLPLLRRLSDSPSPSRRCWQASAHRGLLFRSIGSYFTCRPTTSPHRAKTAPTSERHAFSGYARALHRPGSCSADPTQL